MVTESVFTHAYSSDVFFFGSWTLFNVFDIEIQSSLVIII